MLNFEFFLPTHFVFGKDTELLTGEKIRELGGSHVLLHYGSGSAVRSGLIDRVEKSLLDAGLKVEKLGGAQPNPRDTLVYEGIKLIRETGVDFVLAVGGGSAIDSAKAMAVGSLYDGDFWDFYCGKAKPSKCMPVGVVLTLAAAGSESSNSSVITQVSTGTKRGLSTELQRPCLAIMNPALTCTLPPYQTACGVTDMMAHILERYFSDTEGVDVTDRLCEALLLSAIAAARKAMADPMDYDARAQLMWVGALAHNNTCGVGRQQDWSSHQIEHELSGLYDVAHGAGLAVVFPAWMRYVVARKGVMRFAQLANRVWGCQMNYADPMVTALEGIKCFEDFLQEIGMPITLKELGAKTEDIPFVGDHTKRNNQGQFTGYFVPLDSQAIQDILHIADR